MIVTQSVNVKICSRNYKHYRDFGYEDVKVGNVIAVTPTDLPRYSKTKIKVSCDMCEKIIMDVAYTNYVSVVEKTGSYCCVSCGRIKQRMYNKKKYGKEYYFQTEEFKCNQVARCQERYGVDYYCQTEECKEKIVNTNLKKYNVKCTMQNDNIKQKVQKNNMKKYGYPYTLQVPEIRKQIETTNLMKYNFKVATKNPNIKEKIRATFIERYGGDCSSHVPEIQKKIANSVFKNNNGAVSSQQYYLHTLWGGYLNYPIAKYLGDIVFVKERICVEYNGGGHSISVKIGAISMEDFNRKEIIRDIVIKNNGYKIIKIISMHDKLPTIDILNDMLLKSRQYFKDFPNHTWYEWDIDNGMFRNAEHKDGEYFDFGKLSLIEKSDNNAQVV